MTDFCDVIDLHGMTYDRIMFLIELRWSQLRILPVKDNRPALYRSPSLSRGSKVSQYCVSNPALTLDLDTVDTVNMGLTLLYRSTLLPAWWRVTS